MAIDNENLVKYVKKEKYDPILLDQTITEVTLLVLKRHYSQCIYDDEMLAVGRFKAIMLLNSDYASTQKLLTSFIFSGIRNEVGNILKKNKKGTRLLQQYGEAIICNCTTDHSYSEYDENEILKQEVDKIVNNFKILGIDLTDNFERFFHAYDEKELKGYSEFVLRAAFGRSLIRRG